MGKLDGKVAIITGSSRGLGRDMALVFGREGAKVVVSARTENEGDFRVPGSINTTVEKIRAEGGEAIGLKCNMAVDEEIEELVHKTVEHWGRVDILINNAAILVPNSIQEMQTRHLDLMLRIDLRAPMLACRVVLPHMISQGWGHIINITSGASRFPGPGPYTAARQGGVMYGVVKVGLERFSQGLAQEMWQKNVAVNVLGPGRGINSEGGNFFRNTKPEEMKGWRWDGKIMGDAAAIICSKTPGVFTGHLLTAEEVVGWEGVYPDEAYPLVPGEAAAVGRG